jgi:hypothetical protein
LSSNEEIERANEESGSGWELKEGKIMKSFEFPSFIKAIEFVNDGNSSNGNAVDGGIATLGSTANGGNGATGCVRVSNVNCGNGGNGGIAIMGSANGGSGANCNTINCSLDNTKW